MQIGGTALHRAAGKLIDAARQRMAEACAVPVADVRYNTGELIAGDRTMTLADLAAAGQMRADETVTPPEAFPFGAYAAVVEVDTELG